MAHLEVNNNIGTFLWIHFAEATSDSAIVDPEPHGMNGSLDSPAIYPEGIPPPPIPTTFVKVPRRRPARFSPIMQASVSPTMDSPFKDDDIQWPFFVIVWILALVTILGNMLAIAAFLRNSKIRSKAANHYIFNLSMADLLVGLISIPVNNVDLLYVGWPFGEVFCKFWLILDYTICFQGMTAIVFISMDRYCWVKWPIKYIYLQTRRRAIGSILVAWLGGYAYFIIHVLAWEHFEGLYRVNYNIHCDLEVIGDLNHAIVSVLLEFVLPLVTVITVNGIVYHKVRKRCGKTAQLNRNRREHSPRPSNQNINETITTSTDSSSGEPAAGQRKQSVPKIATNFKNPLNVQNLPRHWKAAMTLSFMVVTIIILWLPYQVVLIAAPVCKIKCISRFLWESVNYLLWSTAAVNPFIYAYTNVYYRKEMLTLLCFFRHNKCQSGINTSRESS